MFGDTESLYEIACSRMMPTKQDLNGFMMLDRINLLLAKSNGKLFMVTTGELCLLRRPSKQQILGTAKLLEIRKMY